MNTAHRKYSNRNHDSLLTCLYHSNHISIQKFNDIVREYIISGLDHVEEMELDIEYWSVTVQHLYYL